MQLFLKHLGIIFTIALFGAFAQSRDSSYVSINPIKIEKSAGARKLAAEKAYREANAAFNAEYFQASINAYNLSIHNDPYFVEAYYGRAQAKEQIEDFQGALMDYEIVINLNSLHAEAYYNRGILRIKLKEYDKAIEDFNKLLTLEEKNTSTIYFEVISTEEENIPTLSNISTLHNKEAEVLNYRGFAKAQLNLYSEAIADFSSASELKPNRTIFYLNRANTAYEAGRIMEALKDYEKVLVLDPENTSAFQKLSSYKRGCNNDSLELEFYNKSIDNKIVTPLALFSRAVIKFNRGDYKGSLADYDQALELDENNAEGFVNRGLVREKLKNVEGAIQDYTQAIMLKPTLAKGYYNRANAKYKLKQYELSIPDFSKAIELNNSDGSLFYSRGQARYLIKQKALACKDWEKAIELGYKLAHDQIKEYCQD